MALNFGSFWGNLFNTAAEGIQGGIIENTSLTGTTKIDLGDGIGPNDFIVFDTLWDWIKIDPDGGTMQIGDINGGDITETTLKGIFDYTNVTFFNHPLLGTKYVSLSGNSFTSQNPDTDQVTRGHTLIQADANGIVFISPMQLPHGAVITACIVYGNAAAIAGETWTIERADFATNFDVLGGASIGTADTTISNATVDNSSYSYFIFTSSLDTNDAIYGAKITYTI